MSEELAKGPILDSLKAKIAEYIASLDVKQIIALIMSLLAKQPVFGSDDPRFAEIRAEFDALSVEDQQELMAGLAA